MKSLLNQMKRWKHDRKSEKAFIPSESGKLEASRKIVLERIEKEVANIDTRLKLKEIVSTAQTLKTVLEINALLNLDDAGFGVL